MLRDDETILAEDDSLFTARVDPATTGQRRSRRCELAVDPASFHFFDIRSGESLLVAGRAHLPMPAVRPRTKKRCPDR